MYREAMIICPINDNDGVTLVDTINDTSRALAEAFGGCTMVDAMGVWKARPGVFQREPVKQLIAAYEPNRTNDAKLRKLAVKFGCEAWQEAMYVRYASGDVEIIDMHNMPAAAAA